MRSRGRGGTARIVCARLLKSVLAAANVVLVLDALVFPGVALWPVRQGLSLLAVGSLVYGLIMEER